MTQETGGKTTGAAALVESLDTSLPIRSLRDILGGKGAVLARLRRQPSLRIPDGFCIVANAGRKAFAAADVNELLRCLDDATVRDADGAELAGIAAVVRERILSLPRDPVLRREIAGAMERLGLCGHPCAVRSSAVDEDSPAVSFAGMHDSFLDCEGVDAVCHAIPHCWASLFSDRAVAYRQRLRLRQCDAAMAVLVQRQLAPIQSGVMFTADPCTGNRRDTVISCGPGPGARIVSGAGETATWRVRDGEIARVHNSAGNRGLPPRPDTGCMPELRGEQALELAGLGHSLETLFQNPEYRSGKGDYSGRVPIDVEWSLCADGFHILQARPATGLFPAPRVDDGKLHVYVSISHFQLMNKAISPLGLSVFSLFSSRFSRLTFIGGRIYADVSADMRGKFRFAFVQRTTSRYDAAAGELLIALRDNAPLRSFLSPSGRWRRCSPINPLFLRPALRALALFYGIGKVNIDETMPLSIAGEESLRNTLAPLRGSALVETIRRILPDMALSGAGRQEMTLVLLADMAFDWLQKKMAKWLGVSHAANAVSASLPNDPTLSMGLELHDLSRLVRRHPEASLRLAAVETPAGFRKLENCPGGGEIRTALDAFLERYGMRCPGEIDIARPRWHEKPGSLLSMILGMAKTGDDVSGMERLRQGAEESERRMETMLRRLEAIPGGGRKAAKARRVFRLWRQVGACREPSKFLFIRLLDIVRAKMLEEGARMAEAGLLLDRDDIFFLDIDELCEALQSGYVCQDRIAARKNELRTYGMLSGPRVFTSEGEAPVHIRQQESAHVLQGIAVSAGIVEGRARVVDKDAGTWGGEGEILVVDCPEPAVTPIFATARGLVCESGGILCHGAVIAREYGIPSVMGIAEATKRIRTGQRLRVDGDAGRVELL